MTRGTFERAILANPDDVAGYAPYADSLRKQVDPLTSKQLVAGEYLLNGDFE
jgi:uncharacterized protein (TIGR02996 family)